MSEERNWYHVTHRSDGQWAVIKEGAARALGLFPTQKAAKEFAIPIAKAAKGELLVHDVENRIIERRSYMDKDPFPPRG